MTARQPGRRAGDPIAPHVLREYALLADGERGAIVGPRGDIAWLCAPRWHSPSVFASLAGGTSVYSVTPAGDRFVWGGYYEPNSLIWHSRWVTEDGVTECREALAYPGDEHRLVLLRTVRAVEGPARVDVTLTPRANYDAAVPCEVRHSRGVWTMRCGSLWLRWQSGPGARSHGDTLAMGLALREGDEHALTLEVSDTPLPDALPDPDELWRATEANWTATVRGPLHTLAPRDTAHSLAVLHGLTSATGGMVAAATTGLPERSDAGRNYDYRYVWIRDQCYAGQAAAAADCPELLDAAVQFVSGRLLEHGPRLAPAYCVTGEPVPGEFRMGLPGYPGGSDIAGNRAGTQFQLDAFGEALLLFAAADRTGRTDATTWRAAESAAATVAERWEERDAGIWELDDRAWTHSRLTASAGLRAAAQARGGRVGTEWLGLADRILADTTTHGLHPDGHWQRDPDDPQTDAALVLPGLRGATAPGDPRQAATLRRYLSELTLDGYAYRFRQDDRPLPDAEGSFLLCGFLLAMALQAAGEPVRARAWFERTRSAAGPPVLFSEEYDAEQHQMRGNLPQAFVHAIMIECAARLAAQD